jgi:hypothetical protein
VCAYEWVCALQIFIQSDHTALSHQAQAKSRDLNTNASPTRETFSHKMDTGEFVQTKFAQALKTQSPTIRAHTCPYPGHEGRVFPSADQLYDHGKIDHRDEFEGLSPRQAREKFRQLSIKFKSVQIKLLCKHLLDRPLTLPADPSNRQLQLREIAQHLISPGLH